jgi:hypothetical protein
MDIDVSYKDYKKFSSSSRIVSVSEPDKDTKPSPEPR